ncbi:Ribosomal RNA large subunit methyltransferase I [Planctomycetes bacterium Pla86]|uniref:Ribosomal RNA large subunit methyltransferase I n=2 Tax=Engelhardtia mirabilis TaxID=2528011 RepID=A0A518BKJ4_9BACT|nr:Ribosomal RNA large subunit methyltransferase I [Planctomycetes bacterium Pla133]QDV01826.1 Ribosomal RNA large subunit methyltransferase I [Planctomycetes bacterium Pla86]
MPQVHLADDRLTRGPWIYSRRIDSADQEVHPGALVEVIDASGRFVGHALANPYSDVGLRFINRGRRNALAHPERFLYDRLKRAADLRRRTLRLEEVTDAYRVCHGEGDLLPGLVVDRLGPWLVCEHHALGFWNLRAEVETALKRLYPGARIAHRVPGSARRAEGFVDLGMEEGLDPETEETIVTEYGLRHPVQPGFGHKTGFFCDQRDNRQRVARLAPGRTVLDLCCNTGGFALHSALAGARSVTAVDLDETVLERAQRAARLNDLDVEFHHLDAFDYLRGALEAAQTWQVVVLDPPKLAAGRRDADGAMHKYSDLNTLAMGAVADGGLLATFSCSGAVDLPTFLGMVFQAGRRADRRLRLLEVVGAGPDHPQEPDFARSRYLKGALLAVD